MAWFAVTCTGALFFGRSFFTAFFFCNVAADFFPARLFAAGFFTRFAAGFFVVLVVFVVVACVVFFVFFFEGIGRNVHADAGVRSSTSWHVARPQSM